MKKEPLLDTNYVTILLLDCHASRIVRNNCKFKPPTLCYFCSRAQTGSRTKEEEEEALEQKKKKKEALYAKIF